MIVILALFLFGAITMYLWNWLMPELFHLPYINYYQAFGLVLLSKILFGGFRMRGGGWGHRKYWRAKWESMTPDEREKFKNEFAERCRSKWGKVEIKVEQGE